MEAREKGVERIRLMIGCDTRVMGRETRLIDLKRGTRLKEKRKEERRFGRSAEEAYELI